MKLTTNRLINHLVFTIDKSGSMGHLTSDVVRVFDSQIRYWAKRSQELDQETRITAYLFNSKTECLVYDIDVLRLPSLSSYYYTSGQTALIDATMQSLDDLDKTTQIYGDHSYLVICLTDGQENASRFTPNELNKRINGLPDNWTLAVMVPDQNGVYESKRMGFPASNIQVWNVSKDGIDEVGNTLQKVADNFLENRSKGIRGTKNLFTFDTSKLTKTTIKSKLQELSPQKYLLLPVGKDSVIKQFVESWTKMDYLPGSAYYMLTKPEKIQPYKQLVIQDKMNGKVYGGTDARKILNLPDYEVKVNPTQHPNYQLFIQSSSVNRKLVKGTNLLVMK